ncbi:hypothetical protein HDV00_006818 [Rhizophlyctis rosea]|nr:hypothetical protein HDV00_006818 [Rhizophlyctis rosea]
MHNELIWVVHRIPPIDSVSKFLRNYTWVDDLSYNEEQTEVRVWAGGRSFHFPNLTPNNALFHPAFQNPTSPNLTLSFGIPLQGFTIVENGVTYNSTETPLHDPADPIVPAPLPNVQLTYVGDDAFEGQFTLGDGRTMFLEDVELENGGRRMVLYDKEDVIELEVGGGCIVVDPADVMMSSIRDIASDTPGGLMRRVVGTTSLPTPTNETFNTLPHLVTTSCPADALVCPLVEAPDERTGTGMGMGKRATVSGVGRDCPVAIIADYSFTRQFGEKSESYMLSILSDVDGIYRRQLNVGMSVL